MWLSPPQKFILNKYKFEIFTITPKYHRRVQKFVLNGVVVCDKSKSFIANSFMKN